MKKILSFIFMLLVMLGLTTLTACENPFGPTEEPGPSENNDQTIVDEVANSFSFTTTEVSADFTLKTSAAGGVVITWTSNNAAIAINGQNATVTRPAFADGDVTVTLTATFSKGTATATKTYEVKVLKGEDTTQIQASTVAAAKSVETGDSTTFFCHIRNIQIDERLSPNDTFDIDLSVLDPVIYSGKYHSLGKMLGEIGDFYNNN